MTDKIFIVDCHKYDFNSEVYTDYLIACNRAVFLSSKGKEFGQNRDFTIEHKEINKINSDDYIELFNCGEKITHPYYLTHPLSLTKK